jgi:lyso-ornithine lipid O-acyltransferase
MQSTPRRLKPLAARLFATAPAGTAPLSFKEKRFLRKLRAIRRGVTLVVWTAIACLVQALLVVLPGRPKVAFARFFWRVATLLLGFKVRMIGVPARARKDGRPVVFVCNHSSWLDIPILGGQLEACFVSKDDVASWPVISTVARLGRTVFVSRRAAATGRELDVMVQRLAGGDSLVLFPEGTSSDGSRVLPFRSSFFAVAEGEAPPLIQPISLVYDRLAGLPAGRAARPLFAWYGDMDLASHFWRLAQWRGMRASVLLHAPLDPACFASRKDLAQAAWTAVADGAATLRQNRPARPISSPAPVPDAESTPAFA